MNRDNVLFARYLSPLLPGGAHLVICYMSIQGVIFPEDWSVLLGYIMLWVAWWWSLDVGEKAKIEMNRRRFNREVGLPVETPRR